MLIKEIKKRSCFRRQNGQPGRITHRPDRFLAGHGHGDHDFIELFIGDGKIHLLVAKTLMKGLWIFRNQHHTIIKHGIMMFAGDAWIPEVDLSVGKVHRHTSSGKKGPFGLNARLCRLKRAGLRGEIKMVACPNPAAGPKPVAVQACTDRIAVCVRDECRSVPRLHGTSPEPVILVPTCGGRHADRQNILHIRNAAPVAQRLHHFVQASRVADALSRENFVFLGTDHFFPGFRPGSIAGDGIDLPVVADQPKGLRFIPGRRGIGTKTAVEQAKSCFIRRVLEVFIKKVQRRGSCQCLIDNGFGRQGGKKEGILQPLRGEFGTGRLFRCIKPLIKREHRSGTLRPLNERMQDGGHTLAGTLPKQIWPHRHISVLQNVQPKQRKRPLQYRQGPSLPGWIPGHKKGGHGNGILLVAKQIERYIRHDSCSVTRETIGSARPSMLHTTQRLQPLLQVRMTVNSLATGNKSNPARRLFRPAVTSCIGLMRFFLPESDHLHDEII